jgi:hypothetical protein
VRLVEPKEQRDLHAHTADDLGGSAKPLPCEPSLATVSTVSHPEYYEKRAHDALSRRRLFGLCAAAQISVTSRAPFRRWSVQRLLRVTRPYSGYSRSSQARPDQLESFDCERRQLELVRRPCSRYVVQRRRGEQTYGTTHHDPTTARVSTRPLAAHSTPPSTPRHAGVRSRSYRRATLALHEPTPRRVQPADAPTGRALQRSYSPERYVEHTRTHPRPGLRASICTGPGSPTYLT